MSASQRTTSGKVQTLAETLTEKIWIIQVVQLKVLKMLVVLSSYIREDILPSCFENMLKFPNEYFHHFMSNFTDPVLEITLVPR